MGGFRYRYDVRWVGVADMRWAYPTKDVVNGSREVTRSSTVTVREGECQPTPGARPAIRRCRRWQSALRVRRKRAALTGASGPRSPRRRARRRGQAGATVGGGHAYAASASDGTRCTVPAALPGTPPTNTPLELCSPSGAHPPCLETPSLHTTLSTVTVFCFQFFRLSNPSPSVALATPGCLLDGRSDTTISHKILLHKHIYTEVNLFYLCS